MQITEDYFYSIFVSASFIPSFELAIILSNRDLAFFNSFLSKSSIDANNSL